jgi:hypothetical protein
LRQGIEGTGISIAGIEGLTGIEEAVHGVFIDVLES